MTTAYVDFYMELIDACKARYFYSSNYFAQRIELLPESMNFALRHGRGLREASS